MKFEEFSKAFMDAAKDLFEEYGHVCVNCGSEFKEPLKKDNRFVYTTECPLCELILGKGKDT